MKNKGETYFVLGHQITLIKTEADYDLAIMTSPAEVPGPPPHYHEKQQELFYVMSGQIELMYGEEWLTLTKGESFLVPPGIVHTFRNDGPEESVILLTLSPGGFNGFFKTAGVPAGEPDAFDRSLSDELIRRVGLVAEQYGMVIVET